jgi:hypothetical protein
MDRGVAVGIGMALGGAEAGRERKKRVKRGSSSAMCSFYSRTRRWPRRRKWWAADTVGGEAAAMVWT